MQQTVFPVQSMPPVQKMQQMTRALLMCLSFLLVALFSATVYAQNAPYNTLSPALPTDQPNKIEVVEFFSFGCPHCAEFSSILHRWQEKQSADVVVRRVPVSFNRAAWANIARLYYALEAIGELSRLEAAIFRAIHDERINLFAPQGMNDWLKAQRVDMAKFTQAFESFGVMSQLKRGDMLAQAYKIEGVPTMTVNGKYVVQTQTYESTLRTVDQLIAQEKKAMAKR